MKNNSIWIEGITNYKYPKLEQNIDVDVLIIGGGITGLSTAYHLINIKQKICLVERNKIGMGISSKTTGKLTYLQDLMYSKITKKHSLEVAKDYLNSQKDAIKIVNKIVKKHNIDCNLTKQKSFLFASNEEEVSKIKHEQELLTYMGENVSVEKLPVKLKNNYAVSVSNTYYFHAVKYIKSLAKICNENNVMIYEDSNVTELKKFDNYYECYINNNIVKAKKVVLACHYPFFLFPFLFPIKSHLERSYIGAIKVINNQNVSGINTSKNSKSFRYHCDGKNNYFLYLTGSHNLAFKFNIKDNFNNLIKEINGLKLIPNYIWSNIDIITNDYLPYIGYIDENLLIGTGYNTWGMTNGSIAGKILSDLVLNKENKYIKLFDPKRNASSICSVSEDLFSSAKPFIENKLIKNKNFYSNRVLFTKKDGQNIAIYIDEENKKHIVYNRCPHLKCSLIFNEVEKTWDCPCHASRFDLDGNVIEGPSTYNISYKIK